MNFWLFTGVEAGETRCSRSNEDFVRPQGSRVKQYALHPGACLLAHAVRLYGLFPDYRKELSSGSGLTDPENRSQLPGKTIVP